MPGPTRRLMRPSSSVRSGPMSLYPTLLRLCSCGLLAACGPAAAFAQSGASSQDPVLLDPFIVLGDDESAPGYDPTGLDGSAAERRDPPFANELLTDVGFDEMPLGELDNELAALALSGADAAEVAAGSENVNLRGFPTPLRRNGFTQDGLPEVLGIERSELIIGSLVPVVGRAAPGGIRNVQTLRPRGRVTRQLEASADTQGRTRAQARATGVIVPKKSWYLASISRSSVNGPQTFSYLDETNLSAALATRHTRATSTLWSLDYVEAKGNPAPGLPEYRETPGGPIIGPYRPLADFHTHGPRAGIERRALSLGFQLESQISPELTLSSATQVLGRDSTQERFTTGQYIVSTGKFSGVREPTHREESLLGFTHQTDLTRRFSALGAEHKLLAGLELSSSTSADENRGLRPADRDALLPATVRSFDPDTPDYYRPDYSPAIYRRVIADRETRLSNTALVTSLRTALDSGRTVFTLGARQDFSEVEVDDMRTGIDAPADIVPQAEKRLANLSVHAGLNQRVGRAVLLFANASSAVQPSTRVDSRTGAIQDNAATSGLETGARTNLFQGRLSFAAMAYSYTNSNIVRRNPLYQDPIADAEQTQPQLVASGEEQFRGLTTQLGWKPAPSWTFTARAAWIDAITLSSPDLPEEEGLPLTRLPRFSASSGARYSINEGGLKGLSFGTNLTHVGSVVQEYARNNRRRLDYPAYNTLGTNASYTWKASTVTHTLSVSISNTLDADLLAKIARVGAERSLSVSWRSSF